jgi:hypothetical protein
VLLLGDGIMWDAEPALFAALEPAGIAVRAESYWGFGLTRPDWRDWRRLWPAYLAEQQPDAVVVSIGPHDVVAREGPDGVVRGPGDPGWAEWYGGLLDEAAAILTADGARVVWLGMLWSDEPDSRSATAALNAALAALADRERAVTYLDAAAAVGGPDGGYAEADGDLRLRKPDGLHLCAEGAARFTALVVDALGPEVAAGVDPAWRDGAWRADGRYDWDGGPGCGAPVS